MRPRVLIPILSQLWMAFPGSAGPREGSIESLTAIRLNTDPPRIVLTRPDATPNPDSASVVLGNIAEGRLVSIALSDFQADATTYTLERHRASGPVAEVLDRVPAGSLRAWLVRSSIVAEVRPGWPVGAPLTAHVESRGPGPVSAWIDIGAACGIRAGDEFLTLIGGQPVIRLDVRSVETDLAWCRVTRLARGARLAAGDQLFAWPTPAEQRTGAASSTVCYVEQIDGAETLWIPRLLRVGVPREPRVEIFQDGRYAGFATVDRQDAVFWYARVLPAASAEPIAVGATAVVRTTASIVAGQIAAHVFERSESGTLITAGEEDGIVAGQVARAFRGDRMLGPVEVLRVNGGYATVRPISPDSRPASTNAVANPRGDLEIAAATAPFELERLDEIRFAPLQLPDRAIGRVRSAGLDAVVIELTSTVLLKRGDVLALRADDESVSVAVVLETEGNLVAAYALPQSRTTPIRVGATVLQSPRPEKSEGAGSAGP